jgi:hypothetical protein
MQSSLVSDISFVTFIRNRIEDIPILTENTDFWKVFSVRMGIIGIEDTASMKEGFQSQFHEYP